ncbi:MAG: glycosyltransferase [Oscillospiraceae bacterium]|nr:glycosyltransferase [Oscillospiraceae bacterium]
MFDQKLSEDFKKAQLKLEKIIRGTIEKKDTETAMQAINALSIMYYHFNQKFRDDFIEDSILKVSDVLNNTYHPDQSAELRDDTILFYDSFGLDSRGLACIYLKALVGSGLHVVYVTNRKSDGKQPMIAKILKAENATVEYIDRENGYLSTAEQLIRLFEKYHAKHAFEYNQPWDVSGIAVFSMFKNTLRYKINLTDHAFWTGVDAFDYVIEFRDFGASVSRDHRGIAPGRQLMLPYYPYRDHDVAFKGLPFDENKRFIFTGGSLYKTLGEGNIYYKMIAHMLTTDPELLFLYAGSGDDSQMKILAGQFEGRVIHIAERPDFYHIMQRCLFYVNSFPIVGGLMTQYAVTAGKIPLTINHGGRAEGLLLDSENGDVFTMFTNENDLLAEADKLLTDEAYLKQQSERVKKLVISEERFADELQSILAQQKTGYAIRYREFDYESLHEEYRYAFERKHIDNAIANAENKKLIRYFPLFFIKKVKNRILKKKK